MAVTFRDVLVTFFRKPRILLLLLLFIFLYRAGEGQVIKIGPLFLQGDRASGGLGVEMFGYGFGFVGVILLIMQEIAPGPYQTAHYAIGGALMNLGVILPGAGRRRPPPWAERRIGGDPRRSGAPFAGRDGWSSMP
jgi:hypothetical protein